MKPMSAVPAIPHEPIPLLDLSREFPFIREEVMSAIEEVVSRQQFILGPAADRFEQEAASFCQAHAAIGCASGTDALWLAFAALGIGPGHAVVTTPFSFFATASAILRAGAYPVFADIDPLTFNLSPAAVEQALSRPLPPETVYAAIMPVHLYGQCADMDGLRAIAQKHNLKIVEDAAQAFGAEWRGHPAGSLGDAAAFSFYPTKNLSAFGDAGMITATDPAVAEHARALRNHGMRRRYFHEEFDGHLGWNSRLDGIQAAVLSVKLRRLAAGNQRRRELAALYNERFTEAGLHTITLPNVDSRATPIFHQYVIRTPNRDALRAHLTAKGIGTEIYYPLPLHLQESLQSLNYKPGDLPHAEAAAHEVLALPMYPELREDEVEAVVRAISSFSA
ncbi:MAG TPA: DegT/DnrJ/EryC1/StrS family aminotransferase [Acidobacteriaceae bacterium]|nr:DegT/DnrJ/EryC1/StrS family aminotransferase [Acidobacteriaceae bacterium]